VPLDAFLGLQSEKKTRLITKLIFKLMGTTPFVAGLIIYLLFSRKGSLSVLGLFNTPRVKIIAQVSLAAPIIAGLTMVGYALRTREDNGTFLLSFFVPSATAAPTLTNFNLSFVLMNISVPL